MKRTVPILLAAGLLPGAGCRLLGRKARPVPLPPGIVVRFVLCEQGPGEGLEETQVKLGGRSETIHLHPKPVLSNADIEGVTVETGDAGREVQFFLTAEGARKLAEVTRENIGRRLAIVVDGKVVSAPIVREEITAGRARIVGPNVQALISRLPGHDPAP